MKKIILLACSFMLMAGVSYAQDVKIRFSGNTASIQQSAKDSVQVEFNGAHVYVVSQYTDHLLTMEVSGKSTDGQLKLKSDGKVQIKLKNLDLTSQEGAPLWLKNKKRVEIVADKGTKNTLTVAACVDTANNKGAVIWAKDKVRFSGKGALTLMAQGDGCRGINCKDNITIEDLTLYVETRGNNLGIKPNNFGFGGPGGFPDFGEMNDSTRQGGFPFGGGFPGGGFPGFGEMNDSTMRAAFGGGFPGGFGGPMGGFGERNDSTRRGGFGGPMGGFGERNDSTRRGGFGGPRGGFGERNDSTRQGGFPGGFPGGGFPNFGVDGEEGGFGGFGGFGGGMRADTTDLGYAIPGGKNKYYGSTKGIRSEGKIIINSGNVTVITHAAGAEGIEGKQGIEFNGGDIYVNAVDDAINSEEPMFFNGANVIARSSNNDAIDCNYGGMFGGPGGFGGFGGFGGQNQGQQERKPAISITAGSVYAWSSVGAPEEGLDCDMSDIMISGGKVFTVGGGMGEMPSVPTNASAKQPTVLIINLAIQKDEPVYLYDAQGKQLDTITVPFSLRSASVISSPSFKVGETYNVKTKGYEKTFTLKENFTTVR